MALHYNRQAARFTAFFAAVARRTVRSVWRRLRFRLRYEGLL